MWIPVSWISDAWRDEGVVEVFPDGTLTFKSSTQFTFFVTLAVIDGQIETLMISEFLDLHALDQEDQDLATRLRALLEDFVNEQQDNNAPQPPASTNGN